MNATYLRLDQDQINEQHHEIVFDIFVGEAFAARTLRQTHALSKSLVIGFAVRRIQRRHRISTFNTYRHIGMSFFHIDGVDTAEGWRAGAAGGPERSLL